MGRGPPGRPTPPREPRGRRRPVDGEPSDAFRTPSAERHCSPPSDRTRSARPNRPIAPISEKNGSQKSDNYGSEGTIAAERGTDRLGLRSPQSGEYVKHARPLREATESPVRRPPMPSAVGCFLRSNGTVRRRSFAPARGGGRSAGPAVLWPYHRSNGRWPPSRSPSRPGITREPLGAASTRIPPFERPVATRYR
jgi:hypothetical protein